MHASCVKSHHNGCGLAVLLLDLFINAKLHTSYPALDRSGCSANRACQGTGSGTINQTLSWPAQRSAKQHWHHQRLLQPIHLLTKHHRSCGKDRTRVSSSFLIMSRKAESGFSVTPPHVVAWARHPVHEVTDFAHSCVQTCPQNSVSSDLFLPLHKFILFVRGTEKLLRAEAYPMSITTGLNSNYLRIRGKEESSKSGSQRFSHEKKSSFLQLLLKSILPS